MNKQKNNCEHIWELNYCGVIGDWFQCNKCTGFCSSKRDKHFHLAPNLDRIQYPKP